MRLSIISIFIQILSLNCLQLVALGSDQNNQSELLVLKKMITNSAGMDFVLIPSGSFMMGSTEGVGNSNEYPQHKVIISKNLYMSKYPVTVGVFRKFVEATGYQTEGEKNGGSWVWFNNNWAQRVDASWKNPYFQQSGNHPVVCVTWNDAKAFTRWLSEKEGKTYRLPYEAEFEYACRAGTSSNYFFENDTINYSKYGWPQTLTSQGFPTHPVGQKHPNPWGLYDLVGNAWQWCEDWYEEKYYASSPEADPTGPTEGEYKVNRGGMGNEMKYWQSARRDALPPNSDYSNQTFRIVLLIDSTKP